MRAIILAIGLGLGAASPARAAAVVGNSPNYDIQPPTTVPRGMEAAAEKQPWPVRVMIQPLKRGMFIRLPIIDTDPNRGVTIGVMPIWVFQEKGGERIEHILAPSLTHNKTFKAVGTFRYYYYPDPDADLVLRGSIAQVVDREVLAEFHDRNFADKRIEVELKGQYNVDGSRRFFGIGPNTPRDHETNYIEDTITTRMLVGKSLGTSGWKAKIGHFAAGTNIDNGPINTLPDIDKFFPGVAPFHRHQTSALRAILEYDTRDHDVTTTRGSFASFLLSSSQHAFASEYTYQRWAVDLRHFYRPEWAARNTLAANLKFEQVVGQPPFWLLPQLGGKYVHRAYGDGRYVDKGMTTLQLEHRYTFYAVKMAGVTTEFETGPFVGLGTVFPEPGAIARRYMRPVVGGAIRAVAKPQVVGSIDFGVGQEGMTAFMDINYSW